MRELCGDIGPDNTLSWREKLAYLVGNFLRGMREWSFPGKVLGWKGVVTPHGSDSPGRVYVDSYLRQELPKLLLPGNIRVLDIGCGTGYVQKLLAELGYSGEYVGLDMAREEEFGAHSDAFSVSFVESKIEEYHSEELFDLVLSNTAFEHIQDDKRAALVARNLIAEGGVGVHLVPSFWSLFLYLFHGYRQYTPKMLRKVFGTDGVSIVGLGGLASFLVQFFVATIPERFLKVTAWRHSSWYPKLVKAAVKADTLLPLCRYMSAVIVRPTKRKVRVVFAIPSLLVGGIEQQLMHQLARYDRTRFELALVTLFEYEGREDLKGRLPEDVRFESIGMRKGVDVSGWVRLARFLKEWKPDVAVSSMFSANTALRLLQPFFGYAAIAREHNIYDDKKWYHWTIDRLLASVSCRIIAVSHRVATYTAKKTGIQKEKFLVIQNGVDIAKLDAWYRAHKDIKALKVDLGFLPDDKIILTVGRLKKAKNHAALVNGFAKFSKEQPEYRLVIIGAGVEQPELQKLVETIPNERVLLLERYGEAVWPYYAAADWFILPSLREGFPNVMLEAMSFGLPLLGTDISGTEECIEDGVNGFLVPTSASGITGSLRRVAKLTRKERETMGEVSRKKVEQFSIEETVRKYEETFITCSV